METANRPRPAERASLTGLSGGLAAVLPLTTHGTIVTLSNDKTVEIWNTDPTRAHTHACTHVRTPISPAQWAHHFPGLDHRPPCADRT